jgi:hypothetical protein
VTVTTYSDDYAPSHQRRGIIAFLLELIGIAEPKPQLARSPIRQRPTKEYRPKFGEADARERPLPQADSAPVLPPIVKLDPLADLKMRLKLLTYEEFMEATAGLGCDPKTAWKWATEESNVVPMRMAA